MKEFKVGDRVRAVKDVSGWFTIGQIGTVEGANEHHTFVTFDNGREAPVKADEIELIESEVTKNDMYEAADALFKNLPTVTPKPFPTFEEFRNWWNESKRRWDRYVVYNYFAQFGVREVFPKVGKEYKFSYDGENWIKDTFESYESNNSIGFTHIRPIQPSRLEQLKARKDELTCEELLDLIELMEGENGQKF
jgi:hypothetical protein